MQLVPAWAIEKAESVSPKEVFKNMDALKVAESIKVLAESAKDLLESDIPRKKKVIILGALIYLVTVVDAVPDVIFVLGYLDDAMVLKAAISAAS
jgi:uncharacterized membrane protein YkvA (DUF1232 family)